MSADSVSHKIEANPAFHRLGLLVGSESLDKLSRTKVIVFGLGGVGSWAAEALVRSGVGRITIVDNDAVCVTNINRQVQAMPSTVGLPKSAVLLKRLLEINPDCEVRAFNQIFSRETAHLFEIESADYVIDAIDSLQHKLDLIETVAGRGVAGRCPAEGGSGEHAQRVRSEGGDFPPHKLFSCMGMALKLDPTRIKIADIWETKGCPLARLVRQGLKKRNFAGNFAAVYSDELVENAESESVCGTENCFCANKDTEWCSSKKAINGSAVTVTAAAGMALASLVLKDVCYNLRGSK